MDSLLPIKENEIVELRKKFIFQKDAQYEVQGKYLSPQQVELIERQVSCLKSGVSEDGLLYLASRHCGSSSL
ncbi:hypothetical protein AwDysgo_21600 [Bacteroidales bacterium]|nr:hypothetical protein AwDysgo_21600 [Bacteroidales bacterium]